MNESRPAPSPLRQALAVLVAATLAAPAAAQAPPRAPGADPSKPAESRKLAIAHDPLKCLSTEYRPVVDAQVKPGREMESSFVYFRAAGTDDFYYVVMKGAQPEAVSAELPRPLPGLRGIDYFLEALDKEQLAKKTPEYAPPVVPEAKSCKDERSVPATPKEAPKEGLTIGLTKEKQNPVPPGFNKNDVAKVILVTGAVVSLAVAINAFAGTGGAAAAAGSTAASTTAAAGGGAAAGLSSGAIVGIAAGVVAVGAGVAVAAGGGNDEETPSNQSPAIGSASVTPLYGSVPLTVTGTATASDPNSDPVTLTWSWGPSGATGTGTTAQYTYQQAGTFSVTVSASDGKGGTATATAGSVRVDPQGTPQYLAATASWSGPGDLDVRVAGPGGIDVATISGGRRNPAGCGTTNRTESVAYQGNALPAGGYTLFVKHAQPCESAAAVTFSYAVQVTSGSKCGGIATVSPGAEVTACTFTLP